MTEKAHIRPRPIRVAFLIEEHEYWRPMLDAIFADCFDRWGGRFSLLVPCENGSIRESYVRWLELYDPDIIYSYVDLSESEVALIHERFYPSFLVYHGHNHMESRDERAFRPSLPIQALGSLSVTIGGLPGDPTSPRKPIALLGTLRGLRPSQFIQENFGCYGQSLTVRSTADDMPEFVRTVIFVPKAIHNNLETNPLASGDVVTDEHVFLDRIATDRNLIGLSQLSAWLCPRLEFHDDSWAESICLIVGDSFIDRVVFWNGRSHLPVWLDSGLVTLKTSKEQLDDPGFFSSLIGIIRNRIRVPTSNSSSAHFRLRSASLTQSELDRVCDNFRNQDKRAFYSAEAAITLDSCVPSADALKNPKQLTGDGMWFQGRDWHEVEFSQSVFRPPPICPRHMRDVRPLPTCANQGGWALDLDIDRILNYSRFQNVQHRWWLPFRLRMVDAFVKEYQPSVHAPICIPRATRQGLLGLFAFVDGQLPEINLPTDEGAFRAALCSPRTCWPFGGSRHERPTGLVVDIRPSDKGRNLTALLQRSGGIHHAGRIFLQQFWKDQFDRLGGATTFAENRMDEIVRTLQKRIRSGTIGAPEDWERIAGVVVAEARQLRFPNGYIRFDELTDDFETFRNAFWQKNQPGAPRTEWDKDEKRSLAESVQYLCQREILYQGHQWRCPRCCNKNWVSIADLTQSMRCGVCSHVDPAPVTAPWHFKLDTFILEGLREHRACQEISRTS